MSILHANPAIAAQLAVFAAAVRSSPHNLLSRRGLEELESRHIPESVAFAEHLDATSGHQVLDLGTGGGFPGFVVGIVRPELAVTLLDATAKKVAFLSETAQAMGLDIATLTGRAEDLAETHGHSFDVVTARAVAPMERLVPWALPFLRPGGTLHALKGERWPEELRTALPVIERAKAVVHSVPGGPQDPYRAVDGGPRVVIIRVPG